MKYLILFLPLTLFSTLALAQGNPGSQLNEPNYYQEETPATNIKEAGLLLQKYSRQFYLGAGLMAGGYLITSIAVATNDPDIGVVTLGVATMIAGSVIQLISHRHIGKAGKMLERSFYSGFRIQGSSTGNGLSLAYHF